MNARDAAVVNPRFPLFDSLRAAAALSVFAVHLPFAARMAIDNPVRPYLLNLNAGVAVFFLISGFLLYRPFARARHAGERRPATAPYAQRRALRIVPAYWLALPLVVLLLGRSGETATAIPVFSAHGVPAYFGFAQIYDSRTLFGGISPAWSLCIEVTFYALLPLWAMAIGRVRCDSTRAFVRSELVGLAGLFAVGVAWTGVAAAQTHLTAAIFVDPTQVQPWLYVLPSYLDHFAIGMALAVMSVVAAERSAAPSAVRMIDRRPWVPLLLAGIAYFAIAHMATWFPHSYALQFVGAHELQIVVACGLLLPAVFGDPRRGLVRRVLANRVLLWIGLVSYALFLWHAPIIAKLADLGALDAFSAGGFIAAAFGVSLLVAAGSFYAVERPAMRLGRRLSRRAGSQDADVRMRDLARHERAEPGAP